MTPIEHLDDIPSYHKDRLAGDRLKASARSHAEVSDLARRRINPHLAWRGVSPDPRSGGRVRFPARASIDGCD
jgi:hypothetical protein